MSLQSRFIRVLLGLILCTPVVGVMAVSDSALPPATDPSGVAAATPVTSEQLALASQNGIFFGGSIANMWQDWQSSGSKATGINNTSSMVFSGYIGYQYNQNFAGEVGFMYLPAVEGASVSGGGQGKIKSYIIDATLKVIQPLYNRFSVFGEGGLMYRSFTLNGDASLVAPLFGAGVEYLLNPNFSFDLSYNYLAGDGSLNAAGIKTVPNAHLLTLGVNYNFSR